MGGSEEGVGERGGGIIVILVLGFIAGFFFIAGVLIIYACAYSYSYSYTHTG